jgi:integrase
VESEVLSDEWDLTVFGHSGTISFTGISQEWLRQSAKRWASDDLPRRKVVGGRRTSIGLSSRHYVNSVVRLSQTLRMRPDKGEVPSHLGRRDMESFLHRLAHQESSGKISTDARIRACREVRAVLARIRAMGLTRPGEPAAGLADDFTLGIADMPDEPETASTGRDLPIGIMRQICEHLNDVPSAEMRAGFEISIDTGRRPEEVAALAWDCLARESDGLPVLIYDNRKANRLSRRLPISEHTATRIIAQQQHIRARFPATPITDLKLLPTDRRNPDGARSITAFSFSFAHRAWIDRIPSLLTDDGLEFDRSKIVLYAYRHTYAQRHADAGVPIDVLRDLMDHRKLDTTKGYYQVGDTRRREAVDRVAALQFDRHGNHIWRSAQALLDSERARRAVGEVVVPFGVCSEPSNIKAGGNACPYRFRCAGCDHFRTDVSYLPDLTAHLDDLLRNRERLAASTDIDDWVKTDAMPATEEITRIRRLISKVSENLDHLTDTDRAQIDDAIATVRRHRAVSLGMPRQRQPLPDLHPEAKP